MWYVSHFKFVATRAGFASLKMGDVGCFEELPTHVGSKLLEWEDSRLNIPRAPWTEQHSSGEAEYLYALPEAFLTIDEFWMRFIGVCETAYSCNPHPTKEQEELHKLLWAL